jgi:hypothetical protein
MSTMRWIASCLVGTLSLVWIGWTAQGCGDDETSSQPFAFAADSSPPVEGGSGSGGGTATDSGAAKDADSGKDSTTEELDAQTPMDVEIQRDADTTRDVASPHDADRDTAAPASDFIVAYYINTDDPTTTLDKINWQHLRSIGITDIYLRISNGGNYGEIFSALPTIKQETDPAGLKLHAWVFPGFSHAKEVASYGVGLHIDVENYHMADSIPELQQMRNDTTGQVFSICVKPHGYDGDQRYDLLAPISDYIVPMMYVGDYNMSLSSMANSAKSWRDKYGDKFIFALETYESDQNTVAKSSSDLLAEIEAVGSYVKGVALFRYSPSLSKFDGGITIDTRTNP